MKTSKKTTRRTNREREIINIAKEICIASDGEIEIETTAKISEGDDNGAFIQGWIWVDFAGTGLDKNKPGTPQARLEYLRAELRAERISYGELNELQSLAKYIQPDDVELREAAGVPENH